MIAEIVETTEITFESRSVTPVVDLKTEVVHRYVFELRYELGQAYWDRAGRTAREILSNNEGWDFRSIDVNTCQVVREDVNLVFSFGHAKLDLAETQTADVETLLPSGEFGKIAETVTTTVVKNLELQFFPRIGLRAWHLYPSIDRDQSYEFARRLKLFNLDSETEQTLGPVFESSFRLVVARDNHMLRIAVAPFEQQINLSLSLIRTAKAKPFKQESDKKRQPGIDKRQQALIDKMKAQKKIEHYPQFGLLLDLDAYIEDPPYPDHLSVSDFVASAIDDFTRVKRTILAAVTPS